ncbi:hypothetical protein L4C36_17495 [Photobacterium japonica]|uniref:hypothetical protein n=1 Tax=Photobacterium japonica TaxID=2910235 RepID=UPI003D0BC1CA
MSLSGKRIDRHSIREDKAHIDYQTRYRHVGSGLAHQIKGMLEMSSTQHITINHFKLKLADTDDPVANSISWNPVKKGGGNGDTQNMTVSGDKISLKGSLRVKFFFAVFWITGFMLLYGGTQVDEISGPLFFMGTCFSAMGLGGAYFFSRTLTFDKTQGVYFRGLQEHGGASGDRQKQGPLADIYALQTISKRVQSEGDSSSVTRYELNLVFENGERIHVMDHGNQSTFEFSALRLAEFLDVSIWKAY